LAATLAYAAAAAAAVSASTVVLGLDADVCWLSAGPAILSGASAHWIVKLIDPWYRHTKLATRAIARGFFVSIAFFFMFISIAMLIAACGNYAAHLRGGGSQWNDPAQNILMVGTIAAVYGLMFTPILLPFAIAASVVVEAGAQTGPKEPRE